MLSEAESVAPQRTGSQAALRVDKATSPELSGKADWPSSVVAGRAEAWHGMLQGSSDPSGCVGHAAGALPAGEATPPDAHSELVGVEVPWQGQPPQVPQLHQVPPPLRPMALPAASRIARAQPFATVGGGGGRGPAPHPRGPPSSDLLGL